MANNPKYEYNIPAQNNVDRVRLMIPDRPIAREHDPAVFSNEELQEFLTIEGENIKLAAADACEVIAMDRAKQAISVSINSGMSISKTSIPQYFLKRAQMLRETELKEPWEHIDSFNYAIDELGEDHTLYVGDEE